MASLFGSSSKNCLGIDIGTSSIKIVGLSRKGETTKLEKYGEIFSEAIFEKPFGTFERDTLLLSGREISKAISAVLKEAKKLKGDKNLKYNLAASFQYTINKILEKKTREAMRQFRTKTCLEKKIPFIVAGGVAANLSIRENLTKVSEDMEFIPLFPNLKFCGDNAAMIAWLTLAYGR